MHYVAKCISKDIRMNPRHQAPYKIHKNTTRRIS